MLGIKGIPSGNKLIGFLYTETIEKAEIRFCVFGIYRHDVVFAEKDFFLRFVTADSKRVHAVFHQKIAERIHTFLRLLRIKTVYEIYVIVLVCIHNALFRRNTVFNFTRKF